MMDIPQWVLDQQWLFEVLKNNAGHVVSGVAGGLSVYFAHRRAESRQQVNARMVVVATLRQWLKQVLDRIHETETHINSQGAGGHAYIDVPMLPFENTLETVSALTPGEAKAIFELINDRYQVNRTVECEASFQDHPGSTDAEKLFCIEAAKLLLASVRIYESLSVRLGWKSTAIDEQNLQDLKKIVAKAVG